MGLLFPELPASGVVSNRKCTLNSQLTLAWVNTERKTVHPARTYYTATVQFFLSQASGTKHLSDSDIVSSSPDKEKLVLAHPEGFSKDHGPSLSLSPHSLPSSPALSTHFCIKVIFGFKAFSISLSLVSRLSITYPHPIYHSSPTTEASIPASDRPVRPSAITQLSDFPTSIFMLSFILPSLPLLLVSSVF